VAQALQSLLCKYEAMGSKLQCHPKKSEAFLYNNKEQTEKEKKSHLQQPQKKVKNKVN
jgi:Mg-chelatase subunit ChlI